MTHRKKLAVIAEGVVPSIDPEDFEHFEDVERDTHGHVRARPHGAKGAGPRLRRAHAGGDWASDPDPRRNR